MIVSKNINRASILVVILKKYFGSFKNFKGFVNVKTQIKHETSNCIKYSLKEILIFNIFLFFTLVVYI